VVYVRHSLLSHHHQNCAYAPNTNAPGLSHSKKELIGINLQKKVGDKNIYNIKFICHVSSLTDRHMKYKCKMETEINIHPSQKRQKTFFDQKWSTPLSILQIVFPIKQVIWLFSCMFCIIGKIKMQYASI